MTQDRPTLGRSLETMKRCDENSAHGEERREETGEKGRERERWEEGRSVPADRFLTDARHARQIDAKTTHERA